MRWVSSLIQLFYRFDWTGGNPSGRRLASLNAAVSLRLGGAVATITLRISMSS